MCLHNCTYVVLYIRRISIHVIRHCWGDQMILDSQQLLCHHTYFKGAIRNNTVSYCMTI